MRDIELAKEEFERGGFAFVLVKAGRVLASGRREGVSELLDAVQAEREAVRGASLADKIVGKAVAMVAAHAGMVSVFTPLGSEAAAEALAARGIAFEAARLVPLISNKRGDGPCPMERLSLPLDDPAQVVAALREFVAQKRPVVASPP